MDSPSWGWYEILWDRPNWRANKETKQIPDEETGYKADQTESRWVPGSVKR